VITPAMPTVIMHLAVITNARSVVIMQVGATGTSRYCA
jgi:hypothetical protein